MLVIFLMEKVKSYNHYHLFLKFYKIYINGRKNDTLYVTLYDCMSTFKYFLFWSIFIIYQPKATLLKAHNDKSWVFSVETIAQH